MVVKGMEEQEDREPTRTESNMFGSKKARHEEMSTSSLTHRKQGEKGGSKETQLHLSLSSINISCPESYSQKERTAEQSESLHPKAVWTVCKGFLKNSTGQIWFGLTTS